MNGYLNNLALRSMNAGNLVEPRLPSLFEPQRVVESDVDQVSAPDSNAASIPAGAPVGVPIKVSANLPANVPASVSARVSANESANGPAYAEPLPIDAPPAAVEESFTAPEVVNTNDRIQSSFNDAPTKTPVERARANVSEDEEAPDEKTPETMIGEAPVVMIETVSKQSPGPALKSAKAPPSKEVSNKSIRSVHHNSAEMVTVIPPVERKNGEPQQPTPEIQERVSLKTEVVPEVVERFIERTRSTDRTSLKSITRSGINHAWRESIAPEPETAINVTIGRVEVRAVPATNAKPRTSRPESPVMPLEEYLRKQRRGGER